jgi:hypothetical protein
MTARRSLNDALDYGRHIQPIHDLQELSSAEVSSSDILAVLDVSELRADAQPKKITIGALGAGITAVDSIARASGNAALASADTKLPLSGGTVSGQFTQNIVALGLYGSGINCSLGNFFTATVSGATQVVISGVPSNVSYLFTYEVLHQTGTITWPTAVEFPSNTAPTLTTGKTHLFMFITDDAGARWRGSSLVNYDT